MKSFRALEKFVGGGGRPNLMLAQVQVFCPGLGPGQDLTGTGPGLGPGPELDNCQELNLLKAEKGFPVIKICPLALKINACPVSRQGF